MKRVSLGVVSGVAAIALALSAPTAHAQFATELSSGHYDVEALFEGDALSLTIGVDAPLPGEPEDYDPATTIYQLQTSGDAATNDQFPRPTSSEYDFIGVAAGAPVWLSAANSSQESIAPLVGLAAEINTGVFINDEITVRLVGFSGTGFLSGYLLEGGTPTPSYRTDNGISASDAAILIAGAGHRDYIFAFTQPGLKTVTFEATGTLVGGGTRTTTNTYNFGVNFVNIPVAVPEVGTISLMLGAGLMLGGFVARHRK